MTTPTSARTSVTDERRLTTLKHLAGGKDLDVVATIVALPRETVLDIGSRHGYPDTEKLAWAADIIEKKIRETATTIPEQRPAPRPAARAPQTAGAATSTPTAPAPITQPDEIRTLINTAMQHPSKRIQNAAGKVVDDIAKLRTLIREDEEKHAERRKADAARAAARAEVERLEQQLAAAKAKLRGDKPAPATQQPAATTAPKVEHPCRNDGCDRVFDTGQGRSLHERLRCEHRPAAEAS